jgi:S1/P1 Nuclease.
MLKRPTSCLILLLHLANLPALPWGDDGHRLIARIAEAHLSPKARAEISKILGPGASMASVASWADDVRASRRHTAVWHYINIPIDAPRSEVMKYCPPGGCVVEKVRELAEGLKQNRFTGVERQEALKFLIHLVGDLHQPLHCGDKQDRGGNSLKIIYFGKTSNLHAIWDTDILQRMMDREEEFARQLNDDISASQRKRWAQGSIEDWAWEAKDLSRRVAYGNLPAKRPFRLSEDYQRRAERVVRLQLSRAGIRLARILNQTWR